MMSSLLGKKGRGTFICFIGIDGSGKTTQAQALAEAMASYNFKSRYVWSRFEPTLTKPFIAVAKRLFLRQKDMCQDYVDYFDAKQKLLRNRPLSLAYRSLLLIEHLFQISWKIRLPLIRGEFVVCDRYVYDTVADLAVDSGYSAQRTRKALRRYLRWFPSPDLVFLIDLPEDIAYQRKGDIPSLDYLSRRRKAYLDMSQEQAVILLDGTVDCAGLNDIIRGRVKEYIEAR